MSHQNNLARAHLTTFVLTATNAHTLNPFLRGPQNLPNFNEGIVVALPQQVTSGLTTNFMTPANRLGWVLANEQLCLAINTALVIWPNLACLIAIFQHEAEVIMHLDQVIRRYKRETKTEDHNAAKWWASPIQEVGIAYWQACNFTQSLLNFLLHTDVVTTLQHLLPPSFIITHPAFTIQDEWTVCLHPECHQPSTFTWEYSCQFCSSKNHASAACYQCPILGTLATEVIISPWCLDCFADDHNINQCSTVWAPWLEINDTTPPSRENTNVKA